MAGETNLQQLIKNASPFLNEGEFVFCAILEGTVIDWQNAVAVFREKEAVTLVVRRSFADELNLQYESIFSWITLQVHSSLEAVGLTAAFSTALAHAGISCNVIAAYYHDHIFVPQQEAERAMHVLQHLNAGDLL